MADHAAGDDIFVYTGGIAPQHVVNAIIDESVDKIENHAFRDNPNLRSVVCHAGLLKVGKWAFHNCSSLQRVKMPGVKIIEQGAFDICNSLTHVEFDTLETVGSGAFFECHSLHRIKLPKVKTIGKCAFLNSGVEDAELSEDLETIGSGAFRDSKLRRIAIPLKDEMFEFNDPEETYTQFHDSNLAIVDLVGGIHKTVSSLHLESWRDAMNEQIQRINHIILPFNDDPDEETSKIVEWIQSVIEKIESYKTEHRALLKEVTTLLELALWKARLDGGEEVGNNGKVGGAKETDFEEVKLVKKAKIDPNSCKRKGARVTCGADVVIKNVLPFLMLE